MRIVVATTVGGASRACCTVVSVYSTAVCGIQNVAGDAMA